MKRVIYLIMVAALICGCKKKEKEKEPGSIYGVITDKATGEPIRAAGVQLNTGTKTVTGSEGQYEFTELKAGEYTITVTKTGYTELVGYKITVEAGKTNKGDVQIEKLPMALRVVNDRGQNLDTLAFGSEASLVSRSFNIFNDSPENLEWVIAENCEWITELSKSAGTLQPGKQQPVVLTIDREKLGAGNNVYVLNISSDNGTKELIITAIGSERGLAMLNTLDVNNITTSSATFNGVITATGAPAYTERGFVYSMSSMPTIENTIAKLTASVTANNNYSVVATGLTLNQTYYVRAYAINAVGTAYSTNEKSFTTTMILPSVTTQAVSYKSISGGTATFNGTIVSVGDPAYTERGFVYSINHNPTIEDNSILVTGIGTGAFSKNITGLIEGNVYYVRAYAKNDKGYAYGTEVSLNFHAVLPTFSIVEISNITQTAVEFSCTTPTTGDPAYTQRGFVYGTSHNPTINDFTQSVSGTGTTLFNLSISGLTQATPYYVRAYASVGLNIYYSTETAFTTKLTATGNVKNISNEAIANANIVVKQNSTAITSTTSNSSGDFSIVVNPGTYSIIISATGYISQTQSVTLSSSQTSINIIMEKLGKLIGTLKDDDNMPLAGVNVNLRNTSLSVNTNATTDANGNFIFNNLALSSTYRVSASKDNYSDLNANNVSIVSGDNVQNYVMNIIVPFSFDDGDGILNPLSGYVTFKCNNTSLPGTSTTKLIRIKNNRQISQSWSITNIPVYGITFSSNSGTVAANGVVNITLTFIYPNGTGTQLGRVQMNLSNCIINGTNYTKTYVWNWTDKRVGSWSYCDAYCSQDPIITVGNFSNAFTLTFEQNIVWQ